jgi:ABC-type uncharacterized transport system fused permease/ATPase subunit
MPNIMLFWIVSAIVCVVFYLYNLHTNRTRINGAHVVFMLAYVLLAPLGVLHVLLEIGLRISSIRHKEDDREARYYNRLL